MKNYIARNERIKGEYYRYRVEVDGKSEGAINDICKSLYRFEEYKGKNGRQA